MRFKSFITEEFDKSLFRTSAMDEDKAIDMIRNLCQKAVDASKKGHSIFRGVPHSSSPFAFVDPSTRQRKSKNTDNLYTLVIDNDPKWKSYPKRSQSIICASSSVGADNYGKVYQVFPFDGANYGICPGSDMWESFDKTIGSEESLDDFNFVILNGVGKGYCKLQIPKLDTYKQLKDYAVLFDDVYKNSDDKLKHQISDYADFMKGYKGDLIDFLQTILSPDKNGFKHTKNPMDIPKNNTFECWTDSKCILVEDKWLAPWGDKNTVKMHWDMITK